MVRSLLALTLSLGIASSSFAFDFSPVPRLPWFWSPAARAERQAAAKAWAQLSAERAVPAPRLGGPCPGPATAVQPACAVVEDPPPCAADRRGTDEPARAVPCVIGLLGQGGGR